MAAENTSSVLTEPQDNKKAMDDVKAQVMSLRAMSKTKLREVMNRMVNSSNIEVEFKKSNSHLSVNEKADIEKLIFPDEKPVICGYLTGGIRDRPTVKIDSKNYYCSNVAFFFYLSHIKYPDEDLTKKGADWWKEHYPFEHEVSHLYDGVRPDCNPKNLTMENHDLNKSRVFCRLYFEKIERKKRAAGLTEAEAYAYAKQKAEKTCAHLHDPRCKFLEPTVGRAVDATLKRRRQDRMDAQQNKGTQKKRNKAAATQKSVDAKEAKKAKVVQKKARIEKKRKLNSGEASAADA